MAGHAGAFAVNAISRSYRPWSYEIQRKSQFDPRRANSAWKIGRDISGLEAKFVTRSINGVFCADQRIFRHCQSNNNGNTTCYNFEHHWHCCHVPNWINLLVPLIAVVDSTADFRKLREFQETKRQFREGLPIG
jgi:hypothetical protein